MDRVPEIQHRRVYTLRARGALLELETWSTGSEENHAQLRVDGVVVDEGCCETLEHADLAEDTPHHTHVEWGFRTGKVKRCVLVEPGKGEIEKRSIPYAPPPGTRAARKHEWGQRHPNLYAARHVVANLAGTAAALLGLAALLRYVVEPLIPDVDAPDVNLPDAPSVDLPDWLKYLNPFWYLAKAINWLGELLAPVFDFIAPFFAWIPDEAGKYIIGFLFAVGAAIREVRRRRKLAAAAQVEPVPDEVRARVAAAAPAGVTERAPEPAEAAGRESVHHGAATPFDQDVPEPR